MTLLHILIFTLSALVYQVVMPPRWRSWVLMAGCVMGIYWLQSFLYIYYLDFILPSLTIFLTILVWALTQQGHFQKEDKFAFSLIIFIIIGLSLTRYLIPELRPTASYPPGTIPVIIGIGLATGLLYSATRFPRFSVPLAGFLIILFFILIKSAPLAESVSHLLRKITGQDVTLADATDLQWIGFSYVAFRLLHILRDWQLKRLPNLTLREHMTYVIFFPAYSAGPIDRAEHFQAEAEHLPEMERFSAPYLVEGSRRITEGLLKKFVIADTLALVALNETNAGQVTSTAGLWVLLYIYAFRLYFDFGGYSDIAIGIGHLFGIHLPENFKRPYAQRDIKAFWRSWHITLSNWAQTYVFLPFSRHMLRMKNRPHPLFINLLAQLSTMVTIGLWHGITINFIIWGIWHGAGLFIHKVWSDRSRKYHIQAMKSPLQRNIWQAAGIFLTFHFVVIGWVWFCLPEFDSAQQVFLQLWGMR